MRAKVALICGCIYHFRYVLGRIAMDRIKTVSDFAPSAHEGATEYLYDMLGQLARLAREAGETPVAIHLEAIIAARRATPKEQSVSA